MYLQKGLEIIQLHELFLAAFMPHNQEAAHLPDALDIRPENGLIYQNATGVSKRERGPKEQDTAATQPFIRIGRGSHAESVPFMVHPQAPTVGRNNPFERKKYRGIV